MTFHLMGDNLSNVVNDLVDRVTYLESEFTDKDEYVEIENRIYRLENEVSYRDVYIYITVFYLIYWTYFSSINLIHPYF